MGVRGLTTYVRNNDYLLLKYHVLHDTVLVIDGHSVCFQLYQNLKTFSAFGGDYDKYASFVKKFFKNLKKCNISCYVLFDGCLETSKLKTAYSRLRSKIKGASRLDPVTQRTLQLFPILLRDQFKLVLLELKIPFTVCEFEADDEIAAMARHLNCPVLSYDSDFFMYNVIYVPFDTLELNPVKIEENDEIYFCLKCKIYQVQYLVNHFDVKQELLPLFGTLLGNDYVQKKVFNIFFSELKLPKGKHMKNEQQRSIQSLLKWLQNETLESAISKIMGRIKKQNRRFVHQMIEKGMEAYNRTECRSLAIFNLCNSHLLTSKIIVDVSEESVTNDSNRKPENVSYKNDMELTCSNSISDGSSISDSETSNDEISDGENRSEAVENYIQKPLHNKFGMPLWFADKIRQNLVPQTYLNLYMLHIYFSFPQAEDYSDDDAFICVLPVLRYAFDILTDFSHESFLYVSREKYCDYKRIYVGREFSISRPIEKSYNDLSIEELQLYFKHFFVQKLPAFDFCFLELLPSNYQLVMLSILWWAATCSLSKGHIHSLFICYIMLEVIDEKTGSCRGSFCFNKSYSSRLQKIRNESVKSEKNDKDFLLNKNKVSYEDCLLAASTLLENFEISPEIRKRPSQYNIKTMHKLAQFQCCLQQFNCLNILCGSPYSSSIYSRCFNGTFVYNIATKLQKQTDPKGFVEQHILKGASTVLTFYKSLCKVYEDCTQHLNLLTSEMVSSHPRRRKHKKSTSNNISFLSDHFESEVVI